MYTPVSHQSASLCTGGIWVATCCKLSCNKSRKTQRFMPLQFLIAFCLCQHFANTLRSIDQWKAAVVHRKLSLEGEIPTGNWSSNTRPFYKRLPTLNLSIRIYWFFQYLWGWASPDLMTQTDHTVSQNHLATKTCFRFWCPSFPHEKTQKRTKLNL